MKKEKNIWAILMMVLISAGFISCGSDDEEGNNISYTETEIVELLSGKWEIAGVINISSEFGESVRDYTGTIEFKNNNRCIITGSYIYEVDGREQEMSLHSLFPSNSYSVLRKGGKSYIGFGTNNSGIKNFQIVSLNKTSFKLVYDETIKSKTSTSETIDVHYYITMYSN